MKRILLVAAGVVGSLVGLGQAKPFYTQYVLNNYILNPAVTGIENYTDVKLDLRKQWVNIDGAPVTSYFSIQGPIGKKDFRTSPTSFQVPGDNPRGPKYIDGRGFKCLSYPGYRAERSMEELIVWPAPIERLFVEKMKLLLLLRRLQLRVHFKIAKQTRRSAFLHTTDNNLNQLLMHNTVLQCQF